MSIVLVLFETCLGRIALFLLLGISQLLAVESIAMQKSLRIAFEKRGSARKESFVTYWCG